ncbi:MAG: class I SAM-dependent methyltransferase [Brevinematales bacterium]|nr:class I SAM-dependent methyltransferase [Brevinematales bacterium]
MNCRLCCSEEINEKYVINNFNQPIKIFECENCGFMFQEVEKNLAYKFYTEDYYSNKQEYSYLDERKKENFSRYVWEKRVKILKNLEKTKVLDKNFLDVGCSFGGLLQVAKENGFNPYGIEVSDYSGGYAKKRFGSDKIFIGSVEDIDLPDNFFSVITMVEVVEHIFDPKIALVKLYNSLLEGGIILIQTANMAGLQAKIFGKNYHYYLPGHLSYFTHKNLKKILKDVGFKWVKIYGGVEFGLLPKLLKSRGDFSSFKDYLKWIRISFYHFMSKLRIGGLFFTSSMVVIARK